MALETMMRPAGAGEAAEDQVLPATETVVILAAPPARVVRLRGRIRRTAAASELALSTEQFQDLASDPGDA